ncbi:MAG: Type 1 glutamine amidotransferase-like domain-containing protein [Anaerolineales bacterium]|jgi:cyanophycinase|nr:Type 1 glutamine amidotransferase-like domain-containing protein [Anaerolineales bacterium]
MLALIGSGEYLPPIEPVDRYLLSRLPGEARVVCLPTAAGTEGKERIDYWMKLGEQHFTRLGVQVESLPIVDQESANQPEYAEGIRQANFIYLSGGQPGHLLRTLRGSLAAQAIESVLESGGVLAGCSAGAMVMGARIPGLPRWQKAFNFLPNSVIIPHYDEIPVRYQTLFSLLIGRRTHIIGVEGNTALVVDHGMNQVVGLGGVTYWNQTSRTRYTDGESLPVQFGLS